MSESKAYEYGLTDGRSGTFENAGRVDVTGRLDYARGFDTGQAERIAAGLPAAAIASESDENQTYRRN